MKPRRTPSSNRVFVLPGGTEDNDLWVEMREGPVIASTWELDDEERAAVAAGANIELAVYADVTPPVSLAVTTSPLGRSS